MSTRDVLPATLSLLFAELINGPAPDAAYMLNGGDPGLLRALDNLSSAAASKASSAGGATIAAHVDHVCYGLQLMNRWNDGEADPWSDADWTEAWRRTSVTDEEWATLRQRLRHETGRWHTALQQPRDYSTIELNGVVASIAHLAYHVGAIRQIDKSIQGPKAS
jgi:hypothetical protein